MCLCRGPPRATGWFAPVFSSLLIPNETCRGSFDAVNRKGTADARVSFVRNTRLRRRGDYSISFHAHPGSFAIPLSADFFFLFFFRRVAVTFNDLTKKNSIRHRRRYKPVNTVPRVVVASANPPRPPKGFGGNPIAIKYNSERRVRVIRLWRCPSRNRIPIVDRYRTRVRINRRFSAHSLRRTRRA